MDLQKIVNKYFKRLKNGEDCFDEFFRETSCYVRYMALKYLCDKGLVDDVVTDTYTRVWKSIDKVDLEQNCYAFLCKVAKNSALRMNEEEKRNNAEIAASVDENLIKEKYVLHDYEGKIDFYTAVQSLPEPERTIVEERVVNDRTLREIAKKVGLSISSVYFKLRKCYEGLKKLL